MLAPYSSSSAANPPAVSPSSSTPRHRETSPTTSPALGRSPSAPREDAAPAQAPRVFGCVIGVQRGRTVEIFNSFELVLNPASGTLERAFLEKQELCKQNNGVPDVLRSGVVLHGERRAGGLHADPQAMDLNESPIYLLLNAAINLSQKDLPVVIYENELHVIDGIPQFIFVRSNYTIETVEAERISVDHVAHLKPSDGGSAATQLAAQLSGIHYAIKMVNTRIHVIHQYLVDMQKGDIPVDNSLLRQVASFLRRLAAMESEKFQDDFLMHDQRGCWEVQHRIRQECWERSPTSFHLNFRPCLRSGCRPL